MKRWLALTSACVFLLSACAKTEKRPSLTMQALADQTLQTFTVVTGNSEFLPGKNRLVFAILDEKQNLIRDLDVNVFFGAGSDSVAQGPIPATFEDDGLADRAFYRAELDLPKKGQWLLLMRREGDAARKPDGAGTSIEVKESTTTPKAGDEAVAVSTPTVADHKGVDPICTREPNDPMHDLSLHAALTNGLPTVVVFSTPALCASRVCGPVVDQVLRVREEYTSKANFVHVEVFADRTGKTFTEGMKAWKLQTEPWTYVIDDKGVIKGAFEGPVTTGEIKTVLEEVL